MRAGPGGVGGWDGGAAEPGGRDQARQPAGEGGAKSLSGLERAVTERERTSAGGGRRRERAERILRRIADRQHGVVTYAEAIAAGVKRWEIEHRLATGALIRVHRGVYRLGHCAPSDSARYMAAVKACGAEACLSGLAAAHHLGLLRDRPDVVEVTAPGARRIEGLRVRRARRTRPLRTKRDRIPVTTPAQTLVDIAARLDDDRLGRACHEAFVRYRCGLPQVENVLRKRPNAPGAGRLLRMLGGDDPIVLSKLERRFLQRLREARLQPPPHVNRRVAEGFVDCRWPHLRLTVELDSYRFHGSRRAWEQDRRRDRLARQRGDELLRYVWSDVFETPEEMLAELSARLPSQPVRPATA